MMILRFTTKAFRKFGKKPQLVEVDKTEKDFGQWYVNTVDSVNQGNLFMAVMHAESLYTMLLPIEKNIDLSDFVHAVFANLLLRILRLEVPRENAEQIIGAYNSHAIFAKTNNRSLTANLSTIIKEIDAIMEWPEKFVVEGHSNTLDLTRLENRINDVPRTLKGETVWPVKAFYNCIRNLCPQLPARQPVPLDFCSRKTPYELMKLFEDNVSEVLAIKARASMLEGEVLFTIKEIKTLLKALDKGKKLSYDISAETYFELRRMLTFKIKQLEEQEKSF